MNKIIYKFIISVLIFSICSTEIIASTIIPLGLKPFDFFYDKMEKFELNNTDAYLYTVAPYIIEKNKFDLAPLSFLQFDSKENINLFFIGSELFNSQTLHSHESLETIRAGLSGSFGNNIFFYSNISLDEQKAEDPNYTGKKWHGLAGGVEQSFLNIRFKHIDIFVGRFKSFWGIKKSLLLSESNALDGFQYTFTYKRLALTYRLAKLNQLNTDLTTSIFNNRYFAGHRLDIRLHKKLNVGLFESIIFGGIGRTIEMNYLNPLLSYHVEQLNNNLNDNSFLGADFRYYPIKKIKLYGQLLIDDYQIEKKSQGDQEPNQYGAIIGGYVSDIVESYDLRIEYIKITNRTYNQAYERNRYTFENKSLGYFNANDFDKLNLTLSKWISPLSFAALHYSYKRKGEGNITDEWSEPWFEVSGDYTEQFPYGIVEKTNRISGQFKGFLFKNFYLDAEAGFENITNRDNREQGSLNNKFITISLFTFFSTKM